MKNNKYSNHCKKTSIPKNSMESGYAKSQGANTKIMDKSVLEFTRIETDPSPEMASGKSPMDKSILTVSKNSGHAEFEGK